ncbi:subclass B1 metallo-beta-lactamase [Carboxylicivirga marina]|uniref:subclass B1 metallo-beta-lactamase n=1 Tax=Carboxylicivirga marina TaxID=2800988 RepID=UPI0025956292|nr:subclass B1 metallo-beta-lactamase [uncultured Carboxylicivirga sp.]
MKALAITFIWSMFLFTNTEAQSDTIVINKDLQLIHLQDSVFVHISWVDSKKWGRFSNNGLLIIKNGEAVMVDTPMSNEQTKEICDYLNIVWEVKVRALIAGHFHEDCIGGLEYLQSIGAKSLASNLTIAKCQEEGLPVPSIGFDKEYDCLFNELPIECRFFGAGHSFDNITIWLPQQKILFGGCLVKAAHARNLGNLSHAVVDDWDVTIEKVQYAYPEAVMVIPGHGAIGTTDLLSHTIQLVKTYRTQKTN